MIKKFISKLATITISLLTVLSCNQNPQEPVAQSEIATVDLRNYDSEGQVYTGFRSIEEDSSKITFSAEVTEKRWNFFRHGEYYGGPDCPSWVKEVITIEDSPNGVNIVYHRPDDVPEAETFIGRTLDWINISYVDGNGNVSTSTSIPWDKMNDFTDEEPKVKETFSIEYPLLLPGKKSIILVNYGYAQGEDETPNQFAVNFEVMPAHGKGCIKDLEKNFVSEGEANPLCINYASLKETGDGLHLKVKKVIPPEGKNLRRAYKIVEQAVDTNYFGENWNQLGWTDEAVLDPSQNFNIDLTQYPAFTNRKNEPYIFAEFNYSYELEEYPGLIFSTPSFKTAIIKCDKFHTN